MNKFLNLKLTLNIIPRYYLLCIISCIIISDKHPLSWIELTLLKLGRARIIIFKVNEYYIHTTLNGWRSRNKARSKSLLERTKNVRIFLLLTIQTTKKHANAANLRFFLPQKSLPTHDRIFFYFCFMLMTTTLFECKDHLLAVLIMKNRRIWRISNKRKYKADQKRLLFASVGSRKTYNSCKQITRKLCTVVMGQGEIRKIITSKNVNPVGFMRVCLCWTTQSSACFWEGQTFLSI